MVAIGSVPDSHLSNLSLLPSEVNDSVQSFMATWSSMHPERVDSYSITVSPPPPSGSGDFTTSNSSVTLQLRNNTLYNITITTSYCHGISQDDTSSHFSIGTTNILCFNYSSMNYFHRSLPIAWSTKYFNYHTPLLLLDNTKRDSSPSV